jgi:UV DNA damage endonuclease
VRPVIHYSYSRDEHLPADFAHDTLPNMDMLLEAGHKKQKLRAHSDWYPNRIANDWALSFLDYADIMCESKCKNLASIALYKYSMERKHNELPKQNVRQIKTTAGPDPIII